ncbi:MAG: hypothetical protein M3Q19_05860 [Pseudomonadota bacterium]|nr:hypothetical protein [Pseudomonadota bacterium]
MSKLLANAAIAMSLMLSASVSAPVWAGKPHDKKCTAAKHDHAKRTTTAAKAQPARGTMLVDHRKIDVQILSFGP